MSEEEPRRYRKKPVVITAQRFNPQAEIWPDAVHSWEGAEVVPRDMSWGYIHTLEGKMSVQAGDWIITGIAGEVYNCKDEIFRASYEPEESS
jgi:hypothetical protein